MNIYNKLPIDIQQHVDKYIKNNIKLYFKENILDDIEWRYICKIKNKLIIKYINREKKIYNEPDYWEEAFNWLENDFGIWLNNEIPTMYYITDNYKNFFERLYNIKIDRSNDLDFYYRHYSSKYLINKYFYILTLLEVEDFEEFINNIIYF